MLGRSSQDFGCTGLAIMTILNVTQTSGLRLFGLTLNVKNSVVFQYPIQLVVAVVKQASNDKNWLFIPPITLSSFFSEHQCKMSKDNLLSYLPPFIQTSHPCRLVSSPNPL